MSDRYIALIVVIVVLIAAAAAAVSAYHFISLRLTRTIATTVSSDVVKVKNPIDIERNLNMSIFSSSNDIESESRISFGIVIDDPKVKRNKSSAKNGLFMEENPMRRLSLK